VKGEGRARTRAVEKKEKMLRKANGVVGVGSGV
jgi:hypothetical protein